MTIWDRSVSPPKAWKVEDGDFVPLGEEDILKCSVCLELFESDPITKSEFCSPGCRIRLAENKAKSQEGSDS